MNKLIVFLVINLIQLSILFGVDISDQDNVFLMKNEDELISLIMEQCLDNEHTGGGRNMSTNALFNSALNNSNSQAMKQLLIFAEENGLRLIKTSEQLTEIIKNGDEETRVLAVMHAPDLVPDLICDFDTGTNTFFFESSTNFLHLLLSKGFPISLKNLFQFKNTTAETLEILIKKDKDASFSSEDFLNFLITLIYGGKMDYLKILEANGFSLKMFVENRSLDYIIWMAVANAKDGEDEMLNHILDVMNAHGNPSVLMYAATKNDGNLFNDLLKKGYKISNDGLDFAINGGNLDTIKYFLEHGADPNSNPFLREVIRSGNIEMVELFISYGAKFGLLHLAAAAEDGSLDLIKYFQKNNCNIKHPGIFVAACGSSNLELIDFFLENDANIHDPNLLVSAARKDRLETLKYLIEKGANPNNLMALNQALRRSNIDIARYLIEKGAKLDYRSWISAGLSGNVEILRWAFEKTKTKIPDELDRLFVQTKSPFEINENIIKYTLEHLVPKDSILIGITNEGHHFTDGIGGIAAKLMEQNENLFIIPLSEEMAEDYQLMKRFSGFINPGAGDSYPRGKSSFSLDDMDKEKMRDYEHLYQRVISFARQYDIPYLGICSGNQHLILNNGGYLQPVKGHEGNGIVVHFEKGSIPHFMALLPREKANALQSCQFADVTIEKASVAHGYAGVKEKLGRDVKLGAISKHNESVPEAVYYGHNQIGVQFHPERGYFNEVNGGPNRQQVLLDNFFDMTINYQKTRAYGLEHGFSYEQVRDSIRQSNEKVIKRLESCANGDGEQTGSDHFWGQDFGSYTIEAGQGESVNMLMGLTAEDLGLLRDGEDLVLVVKSTGEALSIKSHYAESGEHRVKSIDFADGSKLMLFGIDEQIPHILDDGRSVHLEYQPNFYRNASNH